MKLILFASSLLLVINARAHEAQSVPHLDLEMSSAEYREVLKKLPKTFNDLDPEIERAIAQGERLSKWIAKVNSGRTERTAIRLTSPQTRTGIPITQPNVYSPALIGDKTNEVLRDFPASMKEVILGSDELPGTISIDDETFIKHARLLDKNYQMAARYKSVNSWRSAYIQRAALDMRGYYYLKTNKIGAHELRDTNLIPASQKVAIKDALVKLCINASAAILTSCEKKIETIWKENDLANFYKDTNPKAEKIWNDFFVIPNSGIRRDVKWSGNQAVVPFNTPSIAKFIPYLKDNIEDEFRWGSWGMKLDFGSFSNGPRLIFKPGVVPHVNGLGGNEITMDSNQPIEEYESQWTIRHEFGHVIGLPDCYHEFYDVKLAAYVNYQLDITDLMCSRAGNMNERIYKELQRVYNK